MQCDASVLYAVYDGNTPIRAVVRVFFLHYTTKRRLNKAFFGCKKKRFGLIIYAINLL